MNFGFVASLIVVILAVLSVFIEIPIVSNYAFWFAVGAYITAAYWFTASTSFANPAVTVARAASDTFAGIRPHDAPGFIAAQLVGAAVAAGAGAMLFSAKAGRVGKFAEPGE